MSRKQIPIPKNSFIASHSVISSTILTVVVSKLVVVCAIVEPVKDAGVVVDGELVEADVEVVSVSSADGVDARVQNIGENLRERASASSTTSDFWRASELARSPARSRW